MTSEEFLDHAYRLLMTPLAGNVPSLDVEGLLAALKEHGRRVGALTDLPEQMPQMPNAWAEYARGRGMYPEQQQQSGGQVPLLPGGLQ